MAPAKRTNDILTAIRRNSRYNSGRTVLLIISVIFALLALVAGTALFTLLDKEEPMAVLLSASIVLGGGLQAFLMNYLGNVFMDGADSLLQIAKFQERSERSRTEALELARLAAEQQQEEDFKEAARPTPEPEGEPTSEPEDEPKKEASGNGESGETESKPD